MTTWSDVRPLVEVLTLWLAHHEHHGRRGSWPGVVFGLCGDRTEHQPHAHHSTSLGWFWCTADQSQREPGRSERRRRDNQTSNAAEGPGPRS